MISFVPSDPTCGTSLNVTWGGGCVEVRKRATSVIVVNVHHTDGDCYPHQVQYTRTSPLGYCNSLLIGLLALPYTTPCRQFSISSLVNLIQCYSSTPCPPLTQSALQSLTMSHLTRFSLYSPSHPQHGLATSLTSSPNIPHFSHHGRHIGFLAIPHSNQNFSQLRAFVPVDVLPPNTHLTCSLIFPDLSRCLLFSEDFPNHSLNCILKYI